MIITFAFSLFFSTPTFAVTNERKCTEDLLDKAHIQNVLREQLGYDEAAIAEAAYVEAELEIFNKEIRTPVVFVHAPARAGQVFVVSPEGGRLHAPSKYTEFIWLGQNRLAIRDPDGWRLLQDLEQRDAHLKRFVTEHASALESLIERWGYDAQAILRARVHPADFGSVLVIYNDRVEPGRFDYWVIRTDQSPASPAILFNDEAGDAAVPLFDQKLLFRVFDNDAQLYKYRVVDSVAARAARVKDPALARLMREAPELLTRLLMSADANFRSKILASRARPARYLDSAAESSPQVFVLEHESGPYQKLLAVIDPLLTLNDHDRHFEQVRHLVLPDGRRLNVSYVSNADGFKRWRIDDVSSEGTMNDVREILSKPLAAETLRVLKATLK